MSNNISIQYLDTPFGQLILGSFGDRLCLCDWQFRKMRKGIDKRIKTGLQASYVEEETEIIRRTAEQLAGYFEGSRTEFVVPLLPVGTSFQKSVWEELSKIPYGKTVSYSKLAGKVGNESAIRAVGAAVGANAISLLIPCHRATGNRGELTGYAGGVRVKRKLLELESGGDRHGQLRLFSS